VRPWTHRQERKCFWQDSGSAIEWLARGTTILPRNPSDSGDRKLDLPRATSFLQYDYFDFLTRPELRPHDPTGEKVFLESLEKNRADLSKLSVLEGLDPSRQLELAALVLDCTADTEMYQSFEKAISAVRELSKLLGPRKLAKIKEAAALLRPFATTIPEHHQYAPGVSLTALVSSLDQFLHQLPWTTKRGVAEYIRWAKQKNPQTSDPTNEVTRRLFEFFVSRCRLPRNEAEVRVAKIGKARLGWQVQFRESYGGAEDWKGSPAIRRRIARLGCSKQP